MRIPVLVCLGVAALAASAPRSSMAQQASGPSATRCELSTVTPVPSGTPVYDAAAGGNVVARFTGRTVPLRASDLASSRVAVTTGDGSDGVRVAGFIDPAALAIETRTTIPVIPGHLWIGAAERVQVGAVDAGNVRVSVSVREPLQGEFAAWTSCASVGIAPTGVLRQTLWQPATPYVAKNASLALYGEPVSSARRLITLSTTPNLVLWGVQHQGAFMRVRYSGAVVIDAWVLVWELKRIAEDQVYAAQPPPSAVPVLQLLELPVPADARRVVTSSEVALRAAEKGPVIGALEPRTAVLVQSVRGEWASVLPEKLELAPPETQRFWVRTAELGL